MKVHTKSKTFSFAGFITRVGNFINRTVSSDRLFLVLYMEADEKLKDQSGALHSHFSLVHTVQAPNGKLTGFYAIFKPQYTELVVLFLEFPVRESALEILCICDK